MPRKKPVQIEMEGTLHLGVHNPYYTAVRREPTPLERPSVRSLFWKDLTPAWLAQECINRGVQNITTGSPIPERVSKMERAPGGWKIWCYLGSPRRAPNKREAVDTSPGYDDFAEFFVSDAEVETGKMMEKAHAA